MGPQGNIDIVQNYQMERLSTSDVFVKTLDYYTPYEHIRDKLNILFLLNISFWL